MKIPLFDIDGTLFKTGGQLHQEAFNYIFENVYKIPAKQTDIQAEGKTDKQIIIEVLEVHGISPEVSRQKVEEAMAQMSKYFVSHREEAKPVILPGVINLLEKLKEKNVPMGILSGNVETIGWTKIEQAGIREYFSFGAFGDKTEKRAELVEIARQNAGKVLNRNLEINDFIIIGDTPKDFQCAKDNGIETVLVSTGIYSFEELQRLEPEVLVHDFEEELQKVVDFIS